MYLTIATMLTHGPHNVNCEYQHSWMFYIVVASLGWVVAGYYNELDILPLSLLYILLLVPRLSKKRLVYTVYGCINYNLKIECFRWEDRGWPMESSGRSWKRQRVWSALCEAPEVLTKHTIAILVLLQQIQQWLLQELIWTPSRRSSPRRRLSDSMC